jgi:tRNA pseudouridine38-40 synthase
VRKIVVYFVMRFFFEITYSGTNYHGWQNQANAVGVQEVVEGALSKIFRTKIEIVGSGRTDTGVHCVQQFFHTDLDKELDEKTWLVKINSLLPKDIAIRSIRKVKDDAHARYDAVERSYQYKITQTKNPLLVGQAYYFFKEVDVSNLNKAAALLLGKQDFECFSKVKTDVNHFICTIKKAHWNQKDGLLVFTITANRFLRGMVRAIVGTLLDVGTGKITLAEFETILKSKDRKKAGMNVPPEGLYLTSVKYPKNIFLK